MSEKVELILTDKLNSMNLEPQLQVQSQSPGDNGEWGWEAFGSEDDAENVNLNHSEHDNEIEADLDRNSHHEVDSPSLRKSSQRSRPESASFIRANKDRAKSDMSEGGDIQQNYQQNSSFQRRGNAPQHQRNNRQPGYSALSRSSSSSNNFGSSGSGGGGGKNSNGNQSNKPLKGMASSPSFQELEKAIAMSLEANGDADHGGLYPSHSSARLSSTNLTQQKLQQQRLRHQHQAQRYGPQSHGPLPAITGGYVTGFSQQYSAQNQYGPYFGMGMTQMPVVPQQQQHFQHVRSASFSNLSQAVSSTPYGMGMVEALPSGPTARVELADFVNESESRALIVFHSPLISAVTVRDACIKFGALYYIRPDFHSRGVTFIAYFDLRSAATAYKGMADELGPDAEASAHFSVILHSTNNAEEFRLIARHLPLDPSSAPDNPSSGSNGSDGEGASVGPIFSRYGQLRSIQRIAAEPSDSVADYAVEYFNIQDARLAVSELSATSVQIWGHAATVRLAPLDERRQTLCKQLLATLSRWRSEIVNVQSMQQQMQMSLSGHNLVMLQQAPQVPPQPQYGMNLVSALPLTLVGSNGNLTAMMNVGMHPHQFQPAYYPQQQQIQQQPVQQQIQDPEAAASGRSSPLAAPLTYPFPAKPQMAMDGSGHQQLFYAVDGNSNVMGTMGSGYGSSHNLQALDAMQHQLQQQQFQQMQMQQNYIQQQEIQQRYHMQQQQHQQGYHASAPAAWPQQQQPSVALSAVAEDDHPNPSDGKGTAAPHGSKGFHNINNGNSSSRGSSNSTPVHHNGGGRSAVVAPPYHHGQVEEHHPSPAGHRHLASQPPHFLPARGGNNNSQQRGAASGRAAQYHAAVGARDNSQIDADFLLDLSRIGDDKETRTTIMVRNIPNKYNQQMLLEEVNQKHEGTYDFFYLPIDFKNRCNVGYCFINFLDPKYIAPFVLEFNGQRWKSFNSEKICAVSFARIQGKSAMISRFQNSSLLEKDDEYQPLLFYSSGPEQGRPEPFPTSTKHHHHSLQGAAGAAVTGQHHPQQSPQLTRSPPHHSPAPAHHHQNPPTALSPARLFQDSGAES